MGDFASVGDVTSRTLVDHLKGMDSETIEERYILPAEKLIAEACNLDLNTDGVPYHWEATFDAFPRRQTEYLADYKRATLIAVDWLATNPHGYVSQQVRGGGAAFRQTLPREVSAIMRRWGKPNEVFRA